MSGGRGFLASLWGLPTSGRLDVAALFFCFSLFHRQSPATAAIKFVQNTFVSSNELLTNCGVHRRDDCIAPCRLKCIEARDFMLLGLPRRAFGQ